MMTALLLTGLLLGADLYEDTFAQANKAYQEGRFDDALVSYRQLAGSDGPSAEVYYNMGNAQYRLGQLGPAIASYERALQLDPALDEARDNLQVAVAATRRGLARPLPPAWRENVLFWDQRLTYSQVRWAGLLAWVTAWALLGLHLVRRFRHDRTIAAVLLVVGLFCGLSAYGKSHPVALAVAAQPEVPVRIGIGENETTRQVLNEGDRVRVERSRRGWVQVSTIDGESGWAPAEAFAFVGKSPETAPGPGST